MQDIAALRPSARYAAPPPAVRVSPGFPYIGLPDRYGVTLRHLSRPDEVSQVAHLRDRIDLNLHRTLDPDFDLHESIRDTLSVTVAFETRSEIVGTIRAMPMCHGLTLTERLIADTPHAVRARANDWEMGRLVLDPSFRAGPELLRHCLYLALSFLDENRTVDGLHASCTPMLARLYRRLGFETVASDVPLTGTDKTYTLIHGPFQRVFDALSVGQ